MKKIIFLLICSSLFQLLPGQTNPSVSKDPGGMWKCSAPDAPYPYQNFNLLIDTVLGKYTGKIFGEGNVEVPVNSIILKDSIFEISLNIENTSVNLKLKWDGIKLKGAAVSEQGDIAIT